MQLAFCQSYVKIDNLGLGSASGLENRPASLISWKLFAWESFLDFLFGCCCAFH